MQQRKVDDFLDFLNGVNQDSLQEGIQEGHEDIDIQDIGQLYQLINRQKIQMQEQDLEMAEKESTIGLLAKKVAK